MTAAWVVMGGFALLGGALWLGGQLERQRERRAEVEAASRWPRHQPPT